MSSSAQPVRSCAGPQNPLQATLAVHSGTLRKANMAVAGARTLCKVGWGLLEFPVARRSGILSQPVGNFNRTYATVRTAVRSSWRGGRGRFLGCAFLLGGGFGFYQAVRSSVSQHLAEDQPKVSLGSQEKKQCCRSWRLPLSWCSSFLLRAAAC